MKDLETGTILRKRIIDMTTQKDPLLEGARNWNKFKKSEYSTITEYAMPSWKFNRILHEAHKLLEQHYALDSLKILNRKLKTADAKNVLKDIHLVIIGLQSVDDALRETSLKSDGVERGLAKFDLGTWTFMTNILEKWYDKIDPQFREIYDEVKKKNGGTIDDISNDWNKKFDQNTRNTLDEIVMKVSSRLDPSVTETLYKYIEEDPHNLKSFLSGIMSGQGTIDPSSSEGSTTITLADIMAEMKQEKSLDKDSESSIISNIIGQRAGGTLDYKEAEFLKKSLLSNKSLTKTLFSDMIKSS